MGDGLPAPHATSAATAARRPRSCSQRRSGQPRQAAHPRRLQRADRRLARRSSCSRCSPTATASISCSALAESGFDPLARTTRFMLTEEAHHMFVGETGVERVVQRTVRADEAGPERGRARPGRHRPARHDPEVPEPLVLALARPVRRRDLVERGALLRRRPQGPRTRRTSYDGPHARSTQTYRDGRARRTARSSSEDVPLRNAMNEVLRDDYVEDCQRGVDRWNKRIEEAGPRATACACRAALPPPHRALRRHALRLGRPAAVAKAEWERRRGEWLPTAEDRAYVRDAAEAGPRARQDRQLDRQPARGIKGLPFEYEYVRLD